MARKPESSALDFSESSLFTGRFTILALLACGVGFSLYGRLPAALFSWRLRRWPPAPGSGPAMCWTASPPLSGRSGAFSSPGSPAPSG